MNLREGRQRLTRSFRAKDGHDGASMPEPYLRPSRTHLPRKPCARCGWLVQVFVRCVFTGGTFCPACWIEVRDQQKCGALIPADGFSRMCKQPLGHGGDHDPTMWHLAVA